MTLTKKQVQQRVLKNGKPLALGKFTWCEKTKTFSSDEHGLVIDFSNQSSCTFNTGPDCTFKTGPDCTFNTGPDCTFDTDWGCTFKTGSDCVAVYRYNKTSVIQIEQGDKVQSCPWGIDGFLVNGIYNGEPHIIADGILSKIISKKGNIYKVINHGKDKQSCVIQDGDTYAHYETIDAIYIERTIGE